MSTSLTPASPTSYLDRPEGRLGYDVAGDGPLVVLIPGMGDLRAAYRFLAPALRDAGYRVASTDLRGHGDGDSAFASYGDVETAGDVLALIEQLGGPAIIVGNPMGAGAAAIAAAQQPELVRGLALLGPFVRNGKTSTIQRLMLRAAMAPPWAVMSWRAYLPKLYAGQRPDDLRLPSPGRRQSAPPRSCRSLLPHHPDQPRPGRGATRGGRRADTGSDGRAGPRLPRPSRRGRLDRPRSARGGRDGARSCSLPPIATPRPHQRGRAAVPRDSSLSMRGTPGDE
jgi:pimeloyl-ACP methyl ester carboxylesterase